MMTNARYTIHPITPLERLHVYDSLMITAQRWAIAHDYHRHRQNIHYQALHQPGIVCGLGVVLIKPPESTRSEFKDQRWIEVQPGIAIDVEGNVIVVDETVDRTYRIAVKPPTTGTVTVYIVVSYVEPVPFDPQHPEILREQFRFDQKNHPPEDHEIELCRIEMGSNFVRLETPTDVLFPQRNQLNLTCRQPAQLKPLATVSVAAVRSHAAEEPWQPVQTSLACLAQAATALHPRLQAVAAPEILPIAAPLLKSYDLLHSSISHLSDLTYLEQNILHTHVQQGGTIFIEMPFENGMVDDIHRWVTDDTFQVALVSWQDLSFDHPLRSQPFLFAAPPAVDQQPIQIWCGGGVILVIGELSTTWAPDQDLQRSRHDLRTAHEFGVNLLNYAQRRRILTQAMSTEMNERFS